MRTVIKFLLRLAVVAAVLLSAGVAAAVALYPLPPAELPAATEIYDTRGTLITRLFQEHRVEVPLSAIPGHLRAAILAAEDDRFYQHRGIDPRGVARAFWRNLQARRVVEGGSTITQQLTRNLYLSHQRTVLRKVREAILTLKLEAAYSKDEILGLYLNTIYLGEGAYGFEVAAQTYFSKHVGELNLPEAALLAGLPRGPELYNPFHNPDGALQRRNEVLDRMVDTGYLKPDEAAAARAAPLALAESQPLGGDAAYFVHFVQDQIQQRYPLIAQNLHQGGYRIYTTLDLNVQQAALDALQQGLPTPRPDAGGVMQPQAALVALDPRTGGIQALVGGRNFQNSPFNRAVQARRQPGSAFKPFLYTTLLTTGAHTAVSTQVCEPVTFPGGRDQPPWQPRDFEPPYYHNRPVDMREAIARSDNVVAARWMDVIKPPAVIETARSMGIDSDLRPDLTLALGSSEVTVLEMTRAFATLANGGYRVEPYAIQRIEDATGRTLVDESPRSTRVLDERVAYIMTDLMKDVIRPGGTAGQVTFLLGGRPAAGKTGTSEFSHDAWFVGYTPQLVAGVWVGNDDAAQPLPGGHTGATLAAPIWGDFVARALAQQPAPDFPRPPGLVEVAVCRDSGLLATPLCPARHELFLAGTEPILVDPRVPPPPEPEPLPLPDLLPEPLPPGPLPPPAEAQPGGEPPAGEEPQPGVEPPGAEPGEGPPEPPGETPPTAPGPPGSP